jgi:hypothetical protein
MTQAPAMRFSIDSWDAGYGSSMETEGLRESNAVTRLDIETPEADWAVLDPDGRVALPDAVLFVDGVRRIDARVWLADQGDAGVVSGTAAAAGICASYAAGVVCCCAGRSHVAAVDVRRGMFTFAEHAQDIGTRAGVYAAKQARANADAPPSLALSDALQEQLTLTEIDTATDARVDHDADAHPASANDLLVVDGPLRGREKLERAVGYIKSHQTEYLPPELNVLVGALRPGQRTPVFLMGTTWERYSWYLRLPGQAGAPWAGVVRLEAGPQLAVAEATALANVTQRVLGRFASEEYKDARAPQNLYPIAGLEKHLRHRLGDRAFVYRALRAAAAT